MTNSFNITDMALSIRNLNVAFGAFPVMENFSLDLDNNDVYCLTGASGCGKSTLLHAICGIVKPHSGTILINHQIANPQVHTIGYVPQHYGLLPWLNVQDNILLPAKIKRNEPTLADEVIQQLDLQPVLRKFPHQLSGGQQQRVALARAWSLQPDLLLLDEPFAALDKNNADNARMLFRQLRILYKTTTLLVSHNLHDDTMVADTLVTLTAHPMNVLSVQQLN
jgi:NitT/TauT family transport system ATP-binding protein